MRRVLWSLLIPILMAPAGCFGTYLDCDGEECELVDAAPLRYEAQPHYEYRGATVYEVDGRYYRQYGNDRRWVAYRKRPRGWRGSPGPGPHGPGAQGPRGDHDNGHGNDNVHPH